MAGSLTKQESEQIVNLSRTAVSSTDVVREAARLGITVRESQVEGLARRAIPRIRFGENKQNILSGRQSPAMTIEQLEQEPDDTFHETVMRFAELKFRDKKKVEELEWEEYADLCSEVKRIGDAESISQDSAYIEIENIGRPIAITCLSDLHVGSRYTNYEALKRDIRIIGSHPDIFVMKGGDWSDKFMTNFKDAGASQGALLSPSQQLRMVKSLMKRLHGRILAAIGGNHDIMDEKLSAISTESFIHSDVPFPYLKEGGTVNISFGDAKYQIAWKHHFKFNSSMNKFNSHHRLREMNCPNADVVVLEHTHDPGMEEISLQDADTPRSVINIRTGAYKEGDAFSKLWYKPGRRSPSTFIIFPSLFDGRKEILAMMGEDSLCHAAMYLQGYDPKKMASHC